MQRSVLISSNPQNGTVTNISEGQMTSVVDGPVNRNPMIPIAST